jgi:hypothetical protein
MIRRQLKEVAFSNRYYCCPINSLSHRERVGGEGIKSSNCLIYYPLILVLLPEGEGMHCLNKCK